MEIRLVLVLGMGLLLVSTSRAQQQPRTAAPLGMAGGGPAYVRGQDALFLNPANLTLPTRTGGIVLSHTSSLSIYTGGDLYRFGVYDETFTGGRKLSGRDVDEALDEWFGAPHQLRSGGAYADFVPLLLSYHRRDWALGAAVRARLYARIAANRGWLDLALRGSRAGRPTPLHAEWRALWTVDVTVAYSRQFADGRWRVGVAPKVVLGTEYLDAQLQSTATVSGGSISHDYNYRVRSTGGFVNRVLEGNVEQTDRLEKFNLLGQGPYLGSDLLAEADFLRPFRAVEGVGLGLDLGASYQLRPQTTLSVSLTDLGGLRWLEGQELRPNQRHVHFAGIDLSDDRIAEQYDNDLGAYVENEIIAPLDTAYSEFTRRRTHFTTALPTAVHAGVDWRPRGPLRSLNGGLSLALADVSGNVSRVPVGHIGASLSVGDTYALVPRMGLRIGGASALTVAGGLGIRVPYVSLDVGLSGTPYTDWVGRGGRYTLGLDVRVALPQSR